jgi:hypothetical protein
MGNPRLVTAMAVGACVCEDWDTDAVAADEITPPSLVCGNVSISNVAPGTRRSWEYFIVSVMTVSPRFQGEPWTNK